MAWALLVARLTTVAAFTAVVVATRPTLRVARADVPVLVLIGALILGADAMYAVATTEGLLSVVAVLARSVITIALARRSLGERIGRPQLRGIAVAVSGAAADLGHLGLSQSRSRRVAAAFHVATTDAPGASSSSCTEASLSSALSGCGAARPTRTRLATAVTETTLDGEMVLRRAAALACPPGASAISHG